MGEPLDRTRIARVVLSLAAFSLVSTACKKTTENDAPAPEPRYSWWGTLVDSITREGVGGLVVDVRERAEHIANGWDPYLTTGIASDGRFDLTYYLRGAVPCSSFPETTLTVHLDFVDPSGRYAPRAHRSEPFIVCPRVLPPVDQLPLNLEKNVLILLVRQ